MKVRLRYKRDADGRFARVNTLVSRAARAALRDKGDKVSLSKANRRNGNDAMPPVDIPEARVSRGNLSYAIGPAKELSGKYDLKGPDRSESNQKAYREAGKIARQLKAKYGEEAPSANLIYRIARNIQLGTFNPDDPDARKPGEDGSGGKTPRPKPGSDSPKPDAPKKPWREQKAIDELKAAIKGLAEVEKKWEKSPKPQNSEADREIRAARNRLTNAQAKFLPPLGKYDWPEDVPKGFGLPGTSSETPDNPKPAKSMRSIRSIVDDISRSKRYRDGDRKFYQGKIARASAELKDHIAASSREELAKDLTQLQNLIREDERQLKVLKNRQRERNAGDLSSMIQSKQIAIETAISVANQIKTRISEIDGKLKNVESATDVPSEAVAPPLARRNREQALVGVVRSWTMQAGMMPGIAKFFKEGDAKTRAEYVDQVMAYIKNNLDGNVGMKLGYIPDMMSKDDIDKMLEQDRALLIDAVDPAVIKARVASDFDEWLRTSQEAKDVFDQMASSGTTPTDFFDEFNRGEYFNNNFAWGSSIVDYVSIFDSVGKDVEKKYAGGLADKLASAPRPDTKPPFDYEYKATDRTRSSELRREANALSKKMIDVALGKASGPEFEALPDGEKEKIRAEARAVMDEYQKVHAEIQALKPNRSRNFSDAKDLKDLEDIMLDRNPRIKDMKGWSEPDGDLAREMNHAGAHGVYADVVMKRVIKAFEAAEKMADDYPGVPWDEFNALQFRQADAIAHCNRGYFIKIEFNTPFLVQKSPAPNKNIDLFHPPNFEQNPYYNTVIHEFGHSVDWVAFEFHGDIIKGVVVKEAQANGDTRSQQKIWDEHWTKLANERDRQMAEIIVQAYNNAIKSGKHKPTIGVPQDRDFKTWKDKNTSGYAKKNSHELIAESWQDYHANGPDGCSPVSKVVTEFVISKYKEVMKKKGIKV